MIAEGWLELGLVLFVGVYLLIRRPLQRGQLFKLANARLKHKHPQRAHHHQARSPSPSDIHIE